MTAVLLHTPLMAEEVTSSLGTFKKWKALKVRDHVTSTLNSCVAYTIGTASRLEVYAEEEANKPDSYIEPTVQVITDSNFNQYFSALLKIDNRNDMKFSLTLAASNSTEGSQMAMARLKDRKELIRLLRAKNSAHVYFYDLQGKVTKKVVYSLAGSSRTIGRFQFEQCQLAVSN